MEKRQTDKLGLALTWPTVRSAGTKYFFLSMSCTSDLAFFSTMTWAQADVGGSDAGFSNTALTGIRSGNLLRIFADSAVRFSRSNSCLNGSSFFSASADAIVQEVSRKVRERALQDQLVSAADKIDLKLICEQNKYYLY